MQRYLLSRLGQSILILIGVLVLVFFMLRVTGDPVSIMVSRNASAEQVEAFRRDMGFDRPLIIQFFDFAFRAIQLDFGNSLHYKLPALPLILERLPATIQLAGVSLLLSMLIGIPLGLVGGTNPGSIWDSLARLVGLMGQTVPNFWLALILIIVFAVNLGWFPSFGRDQASSVVLPAFALSVFTMGQLVRLTRSAVLEIRAEDYIRTANSKGLRPRIIYFRHVLRNAAIPLVSILGVQFGYLLSGSIYIETIFSWPGIGRLLADSIGVRDFTMVQAIAFFTSMVVVALNLLTDVFYSLLDPRIRYG
jgi:peptide/nickel transport system permease protein